MLSALTLALADLFNLRLMPIWLKALATALALCAALGLAVWVGLDWLIESFAGRGELGTLAAALLALTLIWLAWRVIALAVLQFFADDVVTAIEAQHYPDMAARARRLGWRMETRRAVGSAIRAIVYNLLALPLAAVLLVTGIGAPLVFIAVNAVLLGRELQDMVWLRHSPDGQTAATMSVAERLALGGLTALLLTVPVVNFAAPFLGAACAVHLIHRKGRW